MSDLNADTLTPENSILTAGIDVGSSAVKVVVMRSPKDGGRERKGSVIVAKHFDRIRRRDPNEVIDSVYDQTLELAGLTREEIDYVGTTGEGENIEYRTGHFYGMTTHARGALFLEPEARAAVDVGALHARAIKFDEGSKVESYRMTSQCASGSGQFLENIARYLGVTLDEIGPLSISADNAEQVSGICAVLAETDVINMVSRGITLPNILKGIHESMAGRFTKLLRALKVKKGIVLVTGGLSADEGLVRCLEESIAGSKVKAVEIRTHPDSVYAGAIGAALWGGFRFERLAVDRAA